jgi:hypothetical protein
MAKQPNDPAGPAAQPAGGDDRIAKLEARITELTDKLSKLTITEDEWKTYQKVNAVLAGTAGLPPNARAGFLPVVTSAFFCSVSPACTRPCFLWMLACVLPPGPKGDGTNPGPDFSGLGSGS